MRKPLIAANWEDVQDPRRSERLEEAGAACCYAFGHERFQGAGGLASSHALVQAVYRATKQLPKEEIFGLTVQLRRSATAIATRIAEGCGVDSDVEFGGYLQRAKAAASELE